MTHGPSAPPPLVLTMGEPAGIGGEITLKAWQARRGMPTFFAVDDPESLRRQAETLGIGVPVREISAPREAGRVFPDALPVLPERLPAAPVPGRPDPANAGAVLASIRQAVAAAREGRAAGVVTNPIHKKVLAEAGFAHPGHTEFLAELTGAKTPVMMLAGETLRVVPVTVHLPLKDAIAALSADLIAAKGRITARALVADFGIDRPRLAVAGLNPHAGEGGLLGTEDRDIVAPAVERLRSEGISVSGPAPADSLFHAGARTAYDAVLCMYHDQALIPLKTLHFETGVDVTLGLPIVRTSPDHGTALDIAGRGLASARSLLAALRMAESIARTRGDAPGRRSVA